MDDVILAVSYLEQYRVAQLLSVDDFDSNSFSGNTVHTQPNQAYTTRKSLLPLKGKALNHGHSSIPPILTNEVDIELVEHLTLKSGLVVQPG